MNVRKLRIQYNKKINRFYKTYQVPMLIVSMIGCVVGVVCGHIESLTFFSKVGFVVSLLCSGLSIFHRAMQTLCMRIVGIEVLVSLAVIGALLIGEYSEAGIVTFLFQLGNYLEMKTVQKTRKEVKSLMSLKPVTALKYQQGGYQEVEVDEIAVNDILLVRVGDQIAVDGVIESGEGNVVEASITGEPLPVHKQPGDKVYTGTILDSGNIKVRALRVGEDTTFSKIIHLLLEAQDSKSSMDRWIDRFAAWYTPLVVLFAFLTLLISRVCTQKWDVDTAITVLVLACPGALVIGSPIAHVAGLGKAAKNGIILKGGDALHTFCKTDTVVLDKTGTITTGESRVVNAIYFSEDSLDVDVLYSMELKSTHPLKKAIMDFTQAKDLDLNVEVIKGMGLKTTYQHDVYHVGNERMFSLNTIQSAWVEDVKSRHSTVVILSKNQDIRIMLEIADSIKPDAKACMEELRKLSIKNIILASGDNQQAVEYVANELGFDCWYGQMLPDDKLQLLIDLQQQGHCVTFIGDGINDAPALALADTSIAMGSGTDVAIETSDVIVMQSRLMDVVKALKIAKKTVRISYENIAIALVSVALLLVGLFVGMVHMSLGMLVHEGSILLVIANATRMLMKGKKE